MSEPVSLFTGNALYLDTMIPYALLRGIEPEAHLLFDHIQRGEIRACTSALTFDELAPPAAGSYQGSSQRFAS